MLVVKADASICQGYAMCVESSPSTFGLDGEGTVTVQSETVSDRDRTDVELAVRSCPVSALRLVDE